jgi:hypothetical protein
MKLSSLSKSIYEWPFFSNVVSFILNEELLIILCLELFKDDKSALFGTSLSSSVILYRY